MAAAGRRTGIKYEDTQNRRPIDFEGGQAQIYEYVVNPDGSEYLKLDTFGDSFLVLYGYFDVEEEEEFIEMDRERIVRPKRR